MESANSRNLLAASVPGILLLGHLSDKISLRLVILLSCFGSAVTCLILWGFATKVSVLVLFAIAFGFLGLSFSGVWAALITVIASKRSSLLLSSHIYESRSQRMTHICQQPYLLCSPLLVALGILFLVRYNFFRLSSHHLTYYFSRACFKCLIRARTPSRSSLWLWS